jgi:dihydrofolate reductase
MARNHDYLIGLNGGIPWKVPEDRAYFKETTAGGVLVMGRYTWLENKRHLPHAARTVVLSSDSEFRDRIGSLDRVDTAATLREVRMAQEKKQNDKEY